MSIEYTLWWRLCYLLNKRGWLLFVVYLLSCSLNVGVLFIFIYQLCCCFHIFILFWVLAAELLCSGMREGCLVTSWAFAAFGVLQTKYRHHAMYRLHHRALTTMLIVQSWIYIASPTTCVHDCYIKKLLGLSVKGASLPHFSRHAHLVWPASWIIWIQVQR
jgi:hypothetical protein